MSHANHHAVYRTQPFHVFTASVCFPLNFQHELHNRRAPFDMKGDGIRSKMKQLAETFPGLGTSPSQHLPGSGAATCANLPELPVELWLLIAGYLEPKEKRKLMGVNRLFYELAMDELYHSLSLVSDDPWLFVDTMETLRNPHVGYRVRSVTLWPVSLWKAMSNPKPEWTRWLQPPSQEESTSRQPSWWRRHLSKSTDHTSASAPPKPPPLPPAAPSEAARIALFNKAILNLTRVERLTIYVNGTFAGKVDLSYSLTECLHKFWVPLKETLRHVAIDTPNCIVSGVLPQPHQLPTLLQHVELMLRRSTNIVMDPDAEPPQEAMARFTRDIGRIESFKRLRFSPDSNIGQSLPVWDPLSGMRPMEMITSLSIENIGQIGNANPRDTDLHQWILHHQYLEELSLSFSIYSNVRPTINPHPAPDTDEPSKAILSRLTSLSLKLDRPADDGYSAYLQWVASIAPNVTHLHLRNVKMMFHLRDILDHFAVPLSTSRIRALPKIESLELSTDTLTPGLLDMLATRCPNLRTLKLDVQLVATKEGMTTLQLNSSVLTDDTTSPFYVNVRVREENDTIKKIHENGSKGPLASYYKDWKLEDVSVLQWVYGQGRKYNWEVMSALARVTPSIRSFVCRGHMGQGGLKELEPKFELVGFGKRSEAWS